jgi:two-component system CheB/CheR fusion protein
MNANKQPSTDNHHFIVAIGASAGGLEAIHEFFDNMPGNGNFSFVIIQHLSPDYKSLLVELVAKHTNMQVFEAGHNVNIQPNCIYVIPNNKVLTVQNGHLQLAVKNFEKAPNTAIDHFLHSLAEDQGARAIAVILSGTGTDGSKGIQSIHDAGGIVLVQDPVSAKFDGMPNSAIATGFADFILTPELMPEAIFDYINERPVRLATEGRPDESQLPEVLKLIEKHCQHDFVNYKTPTILRRIERRMGLLGYRKFADYLQVLRNSPDECKFLGKEFLIGVTKFFRDSVAFQLLRDEILPDIINAKEDHDVLKVWVTACSTGEEAYSLAILIDDLLEAMDKSLEVKIFASDIDLDAIEFAGKGIYPAHSVSEIDRRLVNKYFTREGNNVTIQPRLRKQIIFARHNILKDPPFIKNDMVSCRNMLIYMNNILQRKVLATLQFSLNTGGILFLGPSETPAVIKQGFEEVNGKWKIYKKTASDNSYNPERFPVLPAAKTATVKYGSVKVNTTAKELAEDFKNLLTEEYGFAAIYINKSFEIKEALGDFKKYLSLPDHILNLNILKMVPPYIATSINGAVRKALRKNDKVIVPHLRIAGNGTEKNINVFVKPSSREGYIMIVLGENNENSFLKPVDEPLMSSPNPETDSYLADLEDELKETRTNLQMAVESLETANEELQSSNEELLSANEELQSSNEELQSLNEELHTLNTEHQLRIKELIELNEDLDNYFRSTEIAQVFVDKDLRIRKFNPVAVKMINLIESDIGRPIDHISTNLQNYKNFIEDIHQVVRSETVLEKEVVLSNGSPNLMKIMPYIRLDKKVDGVIITFIDISNIKERTEALKRMNLELEASNNELLQFASVASHDLKEPLRKIHLFGSMLRDQHLDKMSGEAYSYIDRVIAASSRMTKLVNDLLSFTRLSGESIFEINDLNVIVKEVISDLELSIAEKNATIEVADLPDMEMVPAQMRQVFQNLISNALKFSRPGVLPHIKIAAERVSQLTFIDGHDQHGQYCRITIKDNGIGFDEEYADRIFTIFQRLHNSEKYEGTGIGLAITKKIIEKHNGIIRAKSIEGKGASFSFVVPLRHKEAKNARQTRVGWRMSDV